MKEEENLTLEEKIILALIPTGRENAITRKQIVRITNFRDRHVRRTIQALRRNFPILSSYEKPGGYWVSVDKEEIKAFIRLLEVERRSYDETIKNLKGCL